MKLPPEILDKIFTQDYITFGDLLQLQLTCKHWSLIAEKALYTSIHLGDPYLGDVDQDTPDMILKTAKLLIRTLVLPNNQSRFWIQTIYFGQMFNFRQSDYISQDPHISIALFAHLCPNIHKVSAKPVTIDFYQFLTQLHCDGYLQYLKYISQPELTVPFDHVLWVSYNNMLREFKHCIKDILILDPGNNSLPSSIALAKNHFVTPDALQNFTNLESLHLVEFARRKLHQLEKYIQKCVSHLRCIEIEMKDERGVQDEGYVIVSVAQPQQQVTQLDIRFNEPITQNDMLCMIHEYPSLQNLCFSVNGPLDDLSDSVDVVIVYPFLEYLFNIPHVDFDEIHLNIDSITQLIHFVARSIQVKTVRFSALDPKGRDQALISLRHRLRDSKPINNKSEQIKTHSCQFEVTLISHEPQILFSHVLNEFKIGDVAKLIIGPQYIQDGSLPLQINQDMINIIFDNYQMLEMLVFTLVEFPKNASAISPPEQKKHLKTLDLQECVINSNYLVEMSRQLEYVNKFSYIDSNVDNYYINRENAKISVHMPYTAFNNITFKFPAIDSYLVKITTPSACIRIRTSREQGLMPLSSDEYIQLENSNNTYQVDMICNAVNTINTRHGSFDV